MPVSGPAPNYYYHYDGSGNVVGLTDSSQNSVAEYAYDAYGNLLSSSGAQASNNNYRYSTKEHFGSIGLYNYGYRFYSPGFGRWINRDPIEEFGGYNLYCAMRNNPANISDLRGLFTIGAGISGSGWFGLGGGDFSVGVYAGYSKCAGWSIGTLSSVGGYVGIGVPSGGISGSGFLQYTNADSVNDLHGPGMATGVGAAIPPVSIDVTKINNLPGSELEYDGWQLDAGPALGYQGQSKIGPTHSHGISYQSGGVCSRRGFDAGTQETINKTRKFINEADDNVQRLYPFP